jgi:hypothetical protein
MDTDAAPFADPGAKIPVISSKIIACPVSYRVNMVSAHDLEDAGRVK